MNAHETIPMPELDFGLANPAEAMAMTGREQMQAIVEGRFPAPPIVDTMHQWIHEIGDGWITFLGDPHPRYLNPMGLVHGGWTMTLLDSALGCAVQTMLAAGETYVSLGTEVKFIRPVHADSGQVRCTAQVDSRGGRTATATGWVTDGAGTLLATGTTTCFIRPGGKG